MQIMVIRSKIGFLAALVLLAVAGSAPAFANAYLLTFSEFPVGTVITNQYAADGVLFSGVSGLAPIIANDGAMPGSPVLSPNPTYAGDFDISFTGGAHSVQFDSGYWDTLGTGIIDVYNTAHVLLASLTNTALGVEHFDLSSYGIIGSIYFNSVNDPAGADIDNLAFATVPEPMSLVLFATGLAVLGLLIRRRKAA
jgi:hypothetical protein